MSFRTCGKIVGALACDESQPTRVGVSRSMTTLLFNVKPTDPAVYAVVSIVLIGVALLASYLPAHRAARIDPLIALRDE